MVKPGKCFTRYCRTKTNGNARRCTKCLTREYKKKYPGHKEFYDKRAHAKKKGIVFTVTREQFLEVWEPRMSIDRIDNSKGYIPGNIQCLTVSDNTAKGNAERHTNPYCPF